MATSNFPPPSPILQALPRSTVAERRCLPLLYREISPRAIQRTIKLLSPQRSSLCQYRYTVPRFHACTDRYKAQFMMEVQTQYRSYWRPRWALRAPIQSFALVLERKRGFNTSYGLGASLFPLETRHVLMRSRCSSLKGPLEYFVPSF